MNQKFSSKSIRVSLALTAAGLMMVGTAQANLPDGVSEADLATRLGPATVSVLTESTALRQQPQRNVRPGVAVPSGSEVQTYNHVYNRDGHWHFIRVGDAHGWVPSDTLQR